MAVIIINKRLQLCLLIKKKVFQFQTYYCCSVASEKKGEQFPNGLQAKRDVLKDEANKTVGSKISTMHAQNYINEYFVNLGKSVEDDFPLEISMKNIIADGTTDKPWSLIILLLSTSITNETPYKSIKSLAQIVESIKAGFEAHHGIINANKASNKEIALRNNKVFLLLGDYFIARAHYALSELKNFKVFTTISTALKILAESDFIGERNVQDKPVPNIGSHFADEFKSFDLLSLDVVVFGKARKEWTVRNLFNRVDLLGRGCLSAMVLLKQIAEVQRRAYRFGCHVGLALQAATELQNLLSNNSDQFCLTSAPLLFALEENPDIYTIIVNAKNDVKHIDYEELKFNILKTEAVAKTKALYEEHAKNATLLIESFGENDSVQMLKEFINIM